MAVGYGFGVLGPVVVTRDGPVSLGTPRERAVLAVLLSTPGRVVPVAGLLSALWERERPAGARATLYSYLSHLRRHLGGRDQVLRRQSPGYVLAIDPGQVDAVLFERSVRDGRLLIGEHRLEEATRRLRHGLGLWRGRPYQEFADYRFAAQEAVRLEELRLIALETLAEAQLALGRDPGAVAAQLHELWLRRPVRERLAWLLMRALHLAGRPTDAVTVFERTRIALREGFGIDPGGQLRRLFDSITLPGQVA